MRRIALAASLAFVALCGGGARTQTVMPSPMTPQQPTPPSSPPLSAPVSQPPPQTPAPQTQPPSSQAPYLIPQTEMTCEAASLAYLVGKPRSAIPVPVDPSRRRVSCTTCPVTQDYRPERTDILFDARTGLITEVKCG